MNKPNPLDHLAGNPMKKIDELIEQVKEIKEKHGKY